MRWSRARAYKPTDACVLNNTKQHRFESARHGSAWSSADHEELIVLALIAGLACAQAQAASWRWDRGASPDLNLTLELLVWLRAALHVTTRLL